MINLIQKLICACSLIITFSSCQKDSFTESVPITNNMMLNILQKKGYSVEDGKLVINEKVLNTRSLDLSSLDLDSVTNIDVFSNLEELNLMNNPRLKAVNGLDSKKSKLKILRLPFAARQLTGNIRAFLKEMSATGKKIDARAEKVPGSTETEFFDYFVKIENKGILNVLFALLTEDAFDLVKDKNGNDIVVFDLSHRHENDHLPPIIDLRINEADIKSYDILLDFINSYFHYLGIALNSLEISTQVPAKELSTIGRLELGQYNKMKKLTLTNLPFTSVILNGCNSLEDVFIGRNLLIHPNLKYLAIKDLDLSSCTRLSNLTIRNVPLEKLSISSKASIQTLTLDSISNVTELSGFKNWSANLKELSIKDTPIKALGKPISIEKLVITHTEITQLDLSLCSKLNGDIIITGNKKLSSLLLPKTTHAVCKRLELYDNLINGELDLSNYQIIRHLKLAEEPFPALKAPLKLSERALTSVKIDVQAFIANAKPWEGMKSYDNLIQIDIDKDLLAKSPSLKTLFEHKGDKRIKIYQFGHQRGLWWTNLGEVTLFPSTSE